MDPAPIRICGAPTGAGKTYAFIRAAKEGSKIIFVVPTQALARDIMNDAQKNGIPSWLWDGKQSRTAKENGQDVWLIRKEEIDCFAQSGGMLITTPETLQMVCFGKRQQYDRIPINIASLLQADHIVFDEAHTLSVRAFGFLHFWAVLSVHWSQTDPESQKLKLTFLSATHSTLLNGFFDPEKDEESLVPKELVAKFDETIEDGRTENIRMLHGNVNVNIEDGNILDCVEKYAEAIISKGGRLLVLYDSLRQLANDEPEMSKILCKRIGLRPDEVFMINGQDKNAGGYSTGGSGFEAGLAPDDKHRVIISTSCIESGVNIKDLRYAILDPGRDAAALLQRIGRIARGNVDGSIWITTPKTKLQHFIRIEEIKGEISIRNLVEKLFPLRDLPIDRARRLGSAYWSMLGRTDKGIGVELQKVHQRISHANPPGKHLNSLWTEMRGLKKDKITEKYEEWLRGIDDNLLDLRGFSPSILIKFGKYDLIEYSREWAEVYLDDPDDRYESDEEEREVWVYANPRSKCMREDPKEKSISWTMPEGTFRKNYHAECPQIQLIRDYAKNIQKNAIYEPVTKRKFIENVARFIESTGLYVSGKKKTGGTVNGIL